MNSRCPEPEMLGSMSVLQLAARWSVSGYTVTRWRKEHGVVVRRGRPRGSRNAVSEPRPGSFTERVLPLLAKLTNKEIAAHVGCAHQTVSRIRARANVAPPPRKWVPPDPARLGKESDAALAREWRVGATTVQKARVDLGIAHCPRATPLADFIRAHAGTMTDAEMASVFRTCRGAVCTARGRLGIATKSERGVMPPETRAKIGESQRRQWRRSKGLG